MAIVWQRLLASRAADHSVVTASIPDLVPVLVLTDAVTFPGAVWPVQLSGDEAVAQIDDALASGGIVFAVTDPSDRVGVAARVVEAERSPQGYAVLLYGVERREATAFLHEPRPRAATRAFPTVPLPADHVDERVRAFRVHAMHWARARFTHGAETVATAEVPEQLIDFVVAHLDLALADRRRLLQIAALEERLEAATAAITALLAHVGAIPNATDPECAEHGALSRETCRRCGCFACETCLGLKPEERLCRACRRVTHPPRQPPSPVAQSLTRPPLGVTWGFAFVIAWVISARRSTAIAGLVGALGVMAFLATTAVLAGRTEPLKRRNRVNAAALYGVLAVEFAVRIFLVH